MRILCIYLLLLPVFLFGQNTEISLNQNWKFKQQGTTKWNTATVPGCVHTDLLNNKMIPDPFFSDNEKKLQWIENENWEYKTEFECRDELLSKQKIELVLEGVDTYAKIFLNDSLILETNNMFRAWRSDVKTLLKPGINNLYILFEQAVKKGKSEAGKLAYTLPGDEKVFTRKAQYQYGWDWGPRFVTCGIWKKVKLVLTEGAKINNVNIDQKLYADSLCDVNFKCELDVFTEGTYQINISEKNNPAIKTSKRDLILKKGKNEVIIPLKIKNPKLWWSNGQGDPFLYSFKIELTKNKIFIDKKEIKIGIRTIELKQETDSIGRSFYFKLNGRPVFIKGANYIPPDNFLSRTNIDDEKELILMSKSAGINMLRIWGGGVYPNEEFLNNCDENGILLWQDMMFACAMYPGDSAFVNNVKAEITENCSRIAKHTCLALLCGNNEIKEGWLNWGWQKQYNYSKTDSSAIWNNYLNLFEKTIPEIISQEKINISYWPSSPSIGWGHKESLTEGDSHYWGVWWGNEPFEVYKQKTGRFMSEYGFQGMPALSTFNSFCDSTELNFTSSSIKNHQKHPTGYVTIRKYLENYYPVSSDFKKYIYTSQLLQRDGMKIAIEAHRYNKPNCMGTMFWQLNDCWPVTSWSCIDYRKTPKAFYYSLKRDFNNILLSVNEQNSHFEFRITSDTIASLSGELIIKIKDFKGKVLLERKNKTYLKANSSTIHYTLDKIWMKDIDTTSSYLTFEFKFKNKSYKTIHYFTKPKNLNLPPAQYSWKQNKNKINIRSQNLIKDLQINVNDGAISLSDNYFDLEPGEEKVIEIYSPIQFIKTINFLSLNDINQTKSP